MASIIDSSIGHSILYGSEYSTIAVELMQLVEDTKWLSLKYDKISCS